MTQSVIQPPINLDYEWPINQQRIQHKTVYVPLKRPVRLAQVSQNFPVEGLSRPVDYFEADGNVEVFVQAVCNVLDLKDRAVAVGGLGNKISNQTVMKIVRVAAANRVTQIYTGIESILSRPAISYLTRKQRCLGFLVHNCRNMLPNYDDEILAIDLIDSRGGPISSSIMEDILLVSQVIGGYHIVPTIAYGDRAVNAKSFMLSGHVKLTVSVVDTVTKYAELLKSIFDFDEINALLCGAKYFRPFRILIDCNGGAGGSYARRIFEVELGAGTSVVNHRPCDRPKALNPSKVGSLSIESEMKSTTTDFGATLDTDGSRVMLYGRRGFHIPAGETLAIITSHYQCIPYFQKNAFNGVSRTHFTTSSVDDVIQKTPLMLRKASGGWLHFNSLMYNGCILLCEDENYGVGSLHVGCSDGIWAVLAWLTMVVHLYKPVMTIMTDHWMVHGRCFLTVYEFHHISKDVLFKTMHNLQFRIFPAENFVCSTHTFDSTTYKISEAGPTRCQSRVGQDLAFDDVTLRVKVIPRGRIIFKTVVAGDEGTFRIIVEVHNKEIPHNFNKKGVTQALFKLAMAICRIGIITGKSSPDLVY